MAVKSKAGAFRRPSGLSSSSFSRPHSASSQPWTPGGDVWRDDPIRPPQLQEGSPEEAAVRKHGSLGLDSQLALTLQGIGLFLLPVSLQDFPCIKNSYCLSLSLSLLGWCFLPTGDLCLFTQQICFDYLLSARHGHGIEDRGTPCSQGIYCPMEMRSNLVIWGCDG